MRHINKVIGSSVLEDTKSSKKHAYLLRENYEGLSIYIMSFKTRRTYRYTKGNTHHEIDRDELVSIYKPNQLILA